MDILDQLRVSLLSDTQINALSMYTGAMVYDTTNKQFVYYDGTDKKPIGTNLGAEPYVTEQSVYPYQVFGGIGYPLTVVTSNNIINAAPISFQQDVELKKISIADVVSPLYANTGYIGVYQLISKSVQSGVEYYQFDLQHTVTPTFNFNVAGAQEITLSTAFKMLAGKVYVVALLNQNASASYNTTIAQRYAIEDNNRFLGKTNRTLVTTTTQAYNPFTNNLPASMPSSLYMYPNTDAYTSREPLIINIQNA